MENNFYSLDTSAKMNCIRISPITDYNPNYVLDEETTLKKDNIFEKKEGKKWYDTVPFLDAANFAISENFKSLLENENITGWSCFPIVIKKYENEKYFAFQIISKRAGKILNLKELNNYEEEFIKFDTSTWDGSDFFTLEETGITACTQKVKNLLNKYKISNIDISPL